MNETESLAVRDYRTDTLNRQSADRRQREALLDRIAAKSMPAGIQSLASVPSTRSSPGPSGKRCAMGRTA
jgi:hypothetical protein